MFRELIIKAKRQKYRGDTGTAVELLPLHQRPGFDSGAACTEIVLSPSHLKGFLRVPRFPPAFRTCAGI